MKATHVYYLTFSVGLESGHGLTRCLCSQVSHKAAILVSSEGSTGKGPMQVHMVADRIQFLAVYRTEGLSSKLAAGQKPLSASCYVALSRVATCFTKKAMKRICSKIEVIVLCKPDIISDIPLSMPCPIFFFFFLKNRGTGFTNAQGEEIPQEHEYQESGDCENYLSACRLAIKSTVQLFYGSYAV